MVTPTAMGHQPLTWGELAAFAASVGIELDGWDFEALHLMSGAFLAALHHGNELMAMGPLEEGED